MLKNVRSGFTLPEILVTVTIIAVLAAAVVPAVTQYVNKGNAPASQQDVHQLQNGVTAFTADTRHYPGDLQQLITPIRTAVDPNLSKDGAFVPLTYTAVDTAKWRGPYTAAPITAAGLFTSNGLNFTVGRTISLANNWLVVPIVVPTSTITDCPAILALDKALDGAPTTLGVEGSTGVVIWTSGTCTAASVTAGTSTAVVGLALRLVPAN